MKTTATEEAQEKAQAMDKAQEEMETALAKLPKWGGECVGGCGEDREVVKIVHEGDFDEIFTYCVNCGGVVV